jgi:nitrite reductase (NADH) small subunit
MGSSSKVKIARASDVKAGSSLVVQGPEGMEVALFRDDKGNICALENSCPHMGGPLGEGEVNGCIVTCPWHGWQFDVRDGVCQNMPGDDAKKIEIAVENDDVFLLSN